MPQLGKVLIAKYAFAAITQLNGIYLCFFLCYQVRTCEAVIPKGRCQSITAGLLFRTCAHSSCGNCGMTDYIILYFVIPPNAVRIGISTEIVSR